MRTASVVLILCSLAVRATAAKINFVRDVKPILENNCVRCHGPDTAMRGIRLDRKERALMALVPGKPDDSLLYNVSKIGAMPPGPKKLSAGELETLRLWIVQGSRWPKGVELVGKNPFLTERTDSPESRRANQ